MIHSIDIQINSIERNINLLKYQLEEQERQLKLLQRQKWWLQHPTVSYFTARTEWETERWSLNHYLCLYVDSVIDINGLEIDFRADSNFPPLEDEANDELITYRNPFLCT